MHRVREHLEAFDESEELRRIDHVARRRNRRPGGDDEDRNEVEERGIEGERRSASPPAGPRVINVSSWGNQGENGRENSG
jgi:hypothetical protein